MNRDDIIRMAQEAGGRFHGPLVEHLSISEEDFLTKLAPALLAAGAAAERAACVKIVMEDVDDYDDEAYNALRARAFAILERGSNEA